MEYEKEYLDIVNEILTNKEYLKRKEYHHHENESVYDHTLKVSYKSYLYAKKHNLNYKNVAIAGLLHDFYYKDWQLDKEKKPLFKKHGFVHAKEALENSRKIFPNLMNERIENAILRHMFPLNIVPPKYIEGWIITYFDKKCSLNVLTHPTKLYKYLGIRGKK